MKVPSFVILATIIMMCMPMAYAQSISMSKAIDAGISFFEQGMENSATLMQAQAMGRSDIATAKALQYAGRECMYAVSMPDSGWVLVAADERVAPILAISYNETFPAEGRELTLYLIQQEQTILQLQEQINSLTR